MKLKLPAALLSQLSALVGRQQDESAAAGAKVLPEGGSAAPQPGQPLNKCSQGLQAQQQQEQEPGSQPGPFANERSKTAAVSKLQVAYEDVTFLKEIGKGSSKTVYLGLWRGTHVAVCSLRRGGRMLELQLLEQLVHSGVLHHPNLVQFYRWCRDSQGNEFMVMEYVQLGPLDRLLRASGSFLPTSSKVSMAEQVCSAMCVLREAGVLHRDLSARNVLVHMLNPVHLKVTDFGLASESPACVPAAAYEQQLQRPSKPGGGGGQAELVLPMRWCPPEVLLRSQWSEKSDVWAYGVTLWEIFSNGADPYASLSDEQVVKAVLRRKLLPWPEACPTQMYRLMLLCWAHEPKDRPTFAEIAQLFTYWRAAGASRQGAAPAVAAALAGVRAPCSNTPPAARTDAGSQLQHAGVAAHGPAAEATPLPQPQADVSPAQAAAAPGSTVGAATAADTRRASYGPCAVLVTGPPPDWVSPYATAAPPAAHKGALACAPATGACGAQEVPISREQLGAPTLLALVGTQAQQQQQQHAEHAAPSALVQLPVGRARDLLRLLEQHAPGHACGRGEEEGSGGMAQYLKLSQEAIQPHLTSSSQSLLHTIVVNRNGRTSVPHSAGSVMTLGPEVSSQTLTRLRQGAGSTDVEGCAPGETDACDLPAAAIALVGPAAATACRGTGEGARAVCSSCAHCAAQGQCRCCHAATTAGPPHAGGGQPLAGAHTHGRLAPAPAALASVAGPPSCASITTSFVSACCTDLDDPALLYHSSSSTSSSQQHSVVSRQLGADSSSGMGCGSPRWCSAASNSTMAAAASPWRTLQPQRAEQGLRGIPLASCTGVEELEGPRLHADRPSGASEQQGSRHQAVMSAAGAAGGIHSTAAPDSALLAPSAGAARTISLSCPEYPSPSSSCMVPGWAEAPLQPMRILRGGTCPQAHACTPPLASFAASSAALSPAQPLAGTVGANCERLSSISATHEHKLVAAQTLEQDAGTVGPTASAASFRLAACMQQEPQPHAASATHASLLAMHTHMHAAPGTSNLADSVAAAEHSALACHVSCSSASSNLGARVIQSSVSHASSGGAVHDLATSASMPGTAGSAAALTGGQQPLVRQGLAWCAHPPAPAPPAVTRGAQTVCPGSTDPSTLAALASILQLSSSQQAAYNPTLAATTNEMAPEAYKGLLQQMAEEQAAGRSPANDLDPVQRTIQRWLAHQQQLREQAHLQELQQLSQPPLLLPRQPAAQDSSAAAAAAAAAAAVLSPASFQRPRQVLCPAVPASTGPAAGGSGSTSGGTSAPRPASRSRPPPTGYMSVQKLQEVCRQLSAGTQDVAAQATQQGAAWGR